jgi:hypothetical protein
LGGDTAENSTLRGARERETWIQFLEDTPVQFADLWWTEAMESADIDPSLMSAKTFGDQALSAHWEGHQTLQRFWMVLSAIHKEHRKGRPDHAYARTVAGLKGLARCIKQKGQWAGAWELTYLPALGHSSLGVSLEEEASLGRYLREKSAVAKAVEEAAKASRD